MKDSCATCQFVRDEAGSETPREGFWVYCHRHAPVKSIHGDLIQRQAALWPRVHADDWCGDFMAQKITRQELENQTAGAKNKEIARRIIDALLSGHDIVNATHGNYDNETFMVRIGDEWVQKVFDVLESVRATESIEPPK